MSPSSTLALPPEQVVPTDETCAWLTPFVAPRWLRNGHAQTVVGNYLRRSGRVALPAEQLVVPVEEAHTLEQPDGSQVEVPESSVLCLCHWQPERHKRLTVVLVHGLEGSASSGYILGNTARLWAGGSNVVRMNMRSCGDSDALSPTIYHSGRSDDVRAVVRALDALGLEHIALVGYSMGGNLVLRYAGEQSQLSPAARSRVVRAVIGVSPLLDLSPSSDALHLLSNQFYERRFLRAMKRRLRLKAQLFPALYGSLEEEGVYRRIRTMRDFDGEIVARYGGFKNANDYYEQVRSSRFAAVLDRPTLILHAADDPFIRTLPRTRAALLANPHVSYAETQHGGHCAFLAAPACEDRSRWAEETVARWLAAKIEPGPGAAA
jgi:predicted alpha/beta-fold hydrolase